MGEAYGFFDCRARPEILETQILEAAIRAGTPPALELRLAHEREARWQWRRLQKRTEPSLHVPADPFKDFLQPFHHRFPKATPQLYLLQGQLRDDNFVVARELGVIINDLYQRRRLYEEGEPLWANILYEENGVYRFLE